MKRRLLFTLSLLLYVTIGFAAHIWPTRVDGICYSCNDSEMTARVIEPINYQGEIIEYEGDIVIPEEIAPLRPEYKYKVIEIAPEAFRNDVTTSIVIPGTIDYIPDECFIQCTNLRNVFIWHGVERIGYQAFANLKHLESFTYNCTIDELTVGKQTHGCIIEPYAFSGCSALTDVNLGIRRDAPSTACGFGVTIILESAFEDCNNLTSITIPDKMAYIAPYAFYGAYIQEVHIADLGAWCNIEFGGPINRGHHLFLNGKEVKDLVLPYGIKSIGNWAFCNCSGLTSVTIPDNVVSIGEGAFCGCWNLTSVTIPESVVSIGESAFSACESLTSVCIPNGVTNIGNYAFSLCSMTSINIPSSVTSIGEGTFAGCSALTSINIGSGVTNIGMRAFDGCSALEAVHITDLSAWCNISYTLECGIDHSDVFDVWMDFGDLEYTSQPLYYAHHLYLNNQEITDLIIPEDVTSISHLAFAGCSDLTSVTIPSNVKSIGKGAFYQCDRLTKIIVPDIAAWCDISFGNLRENPLCFIGHIYSDTETEITNLIIPEGVTRIGDLAFCRCSGLKSVTIPKGVTSTGVASFSGCDGLTSVTIPEGVTSIGTSSFSRCSNLESVTLPESVARIDSFAFAGCSSLTTINIPNSVTAIGQLAFSNCVNLSSVYITDLTAWCNISFLGSYSNPLSCGDEQRIPHHLYLNGQEITDLVIPDGLTSVGNYTFEGCSCLTSVTIPNSVTSIGNYAFSGCSDLTSVTIPNSVTSIDYYAFKGCSNLTSVIIGNSLERIGSTAFSGCNNLTDVYCLTEIVPNVQVNINVDAFVYWKDVENVTLHVPASALDAYKDSYLWSDFGNIVALTEDEIDGINEVENGNLKVESSVYDINGRKLDKPQKGINILRMSDGTTRKVLVK